MRACRSKIFHLNTGDSVALRDILTCSSKIFHGIALGDVVKITGINKLLLSICPVKGGKCLARVKADSLGVAVPV